MSFVSVTFLAFLCVFLPVYWGLRGRWRNAWLLLASGVFYGWVHPWFLGLIAASTVLDYSVGLGMRGGRRRWLLALSISGNLGLLAVFKYLDFFIENVVAMGLGSPSTLGILLPVGISFFTFQTMSYTFDVYRGRIEPRTNLLDFATFVSMFPQLVAGPIERARDLLPQIETPRRFSSSQFRDGVTLAMWGAVKKIVVADTVGLFVDRVFALDQPGGWLIWAATAGFALQILADFSGYTDIARGVAKMMGFELRTNFRRPYLATSPSDFWRRWHISLSSWIHEYVYIPFGGSRNGTTRLVLATVGAMLLSGLWHGASWNFVVWGAYHAALLLLWRAARLVQVRGGPAVLRRGMATGLMFVLTCIGWLIFREPSIGALGDHLVRNPLAGTWDEQVVASVVATVTLIGGALVAAGETGGDGLRRIRELPGTLPIHTGLWTVAGLLIALCARDTARDFIYFRF